jgi:DNA repair protein RadA/Sms
VGQIEIRAGEMKKMGFTRCLVPRNNLERMATVAGLDLIGVKNVSEAMEALF